MTDMKIRRYILSFFVLIATIQNHSIKADVVLRNEVIFPLQPVEALATESIGHSLQNNQLSFSKPSSTLDKFKQLDFMVGKGLFQKLWVSSPASTKASDGLGPLYNARSCDTCHVRNGRGHPARQGDNSVSIILRISIPPQSIQEEKLIASNTIKFVPEPVYGSQLQSFAVQGLVAEGKLKVTYKELEVQLHDGEVVILKKPVYDISDLAYGDLHPNTMRSARVAPAMIGLGLLEGISEFNLLSLADEYDSNGDGISGKPNRVWSKTHNKVMLGRFGYKAGMATLDEQNQEAFTTDLGISTTLNKNHWGECTPHQRDCLDAPHGADLKYNHLEASQKVTDSVLFFTRNIAVPARRNINSPSVLAGNKVFNRLGCSACHHPSFKITKTQWQKEQVISPYTDMLLHDMGEGLADHRPEGEANGREWRTAPLWGIGLTQTVDKRTGFLHDGRARTLQEAILWHGGEAETARQKYIKMDKSERQQLISFLESL